jgi:4-oxalocrotonate tautomerase
MPFISVTMLEGRTQEQKLALIRALTDATVQAAGAKPENVHVAINDVSMDEWGTGGKSLREIKAEG